MAGIYSCLSPQSVQDSLREKILSLNDMSLFSTLWQLPKAFSSFAPVALLAGTSVLGGSPPTCSNPQLSCQNTTAVSDLCCFNAPGGQLLQTQFWDYNPPTGPSDSWTVHGLWYVDCGE